MDKSNKQISPTTPPNVMASGGHQKTPPKGVYLSVFNRVKSPTNVIASPVANRLDSAKNSLDNTSHPMGNARGNLPRIVDKSPSSAHSKNSLEQALQLSKHPHDLMPETSDPSVCEFCLSKEEMHRLQNNSLDPNLSPTTPSGDKANSASQNEMEKNMVLPYKIVGNQKTEDIPTLRLRDIQLKMPQKSTAVEALGKYFNVTVVSPKLDTPKTIVSKVQQEQADDVPRTKSEEFTPMAQEEEEVKRLIEEVRMAGEPGELGDRKRTTEGKESMVLGIGEANNPEVKPVSAVSLDRSESSELSTESVTSSMRSLDYGPDNDDSGLDEELEEMEKQKFVLLRRIPNTFPFSKDCLNVMDVTNRGEYQGKDTDDPQPVVALTVRGIVPLNSDGTPLPYHNLEPEMSTEVDLNCHCCHVEVLPTMSEDDLDDDDDDDEEIEEVTLHPSAEEIRRSFGFKDTSLSALDAIARSVSSANDYM